MLKKKIKQKLVNKKRQLGPQKKKPKEAKQKRKTKPTSKWSTEKQPPKTCY